MIDLFRTNYRWNDDEVKLASWLALICLALFAGITVSHFRYTPDDAYIYFQYAKNLAHGKGFSFYGSTPSYGSTGPLWTVILAGGPKLGITPYAVAKSLDVAFSILAILAMYFLAREVLQSDSHAFLAASLFSLDGWFLRWSGSGMETSFAVFLAITGVYLFLSGRYVLCATALSCLTLVRPEGGLLFGIVYAKFLIDSSRTQRPVFQRVAPAALYASVVGAWILFALWHFGRALPNAYSGKSGGIPNLTEIFHASFTIAKLWGTTQLPIVMVLIVRLVIAKNGQVWRGRIFLAAWVFSLPAFYVLDSVQIVSRYLLIATPFLILLGFVGVQDLCQSLRLDSLKIKIVFIALASLTLVENQILYWVTIKPHLEDFVIGTNDCLKPIGRWLRDNADTKALVFIPDVGIIGYYSDRRICDVGLITPEIAKAFQGRDYDSGMEQRLYDVVLHPDYVVDRSPTPERLKSSSMLPIMTKLFPGLGITRDEVVYYTLYRVVKQQTSGH